LVTGLAGAAEGMWTLDNLPKAELKSRYGFEPTSEWVGKVMRASVRLAQGCSGSFVSASGLDARLTYIRRQSGLDSRAALFVLSPVSSAELQEFVKRSAVASSQSSH